MIRVSDPIHSFQRVERGLPLQHFVLRSTITIDGIEYYSQLRLPHELGNQLEEFLTAAERNLARTVGDKIVRGIEP